LILVRYITAFSVTPIAFISRLFYLGLSYLNSLSSILLLLVSHALLWIQTHHSYLLLYTTFHKMYLMNNDTYKLVSSLSSRICDSWVTRLSVIESLRSSFLRVQGESSQPINKVIITARALHKDREPMYRRCFIAIG